MIKHVGKHNNKKIVLLFRQVPNEEHMALLVYSDTLPRLLHDEVMKALESPVGQNAKELADALFRHIMPDGTNTLAHVHKAGYLKKVPCNQVIVTPDIKSTVRLDELNTILDKMSMGEEAIKELADKVNKIEVVVAGEYIKRDEFDKVADIIFVKLDRIFDKLDKKADKDA